MKNLRVTVNGNIYDVQVEEISQENNKSNNEPQYATSERKLDNTHTSQEHTDKTSDTGSELINAPMPGTIISVNVMPGQKVSKGDVLVILEAMKMENEIMSPRDGVVVSVNVKKGENVDSGSLLVSLN